MGGVARGSRKLLFSIASESLTKVNEVSAVCSLMLASLFLKESGIGYGNEATFLIHNTSSMITSTLEPLKSPDEELVSAVS